MTQEKQEFDFGGCIAVVMENGAFALGMLLMFSKTVDLMSAFAPKSILGYVGIESWYGLAVGVLIEGALFVMKLLLPRPKNVFDWAWNVVVVLVPFAISALAQVFDSFVVRETLAQQPQEIQVFVTWFVPSIPTIIMALFIGKAIFSSIPAEITPKGMPHNKRDTGNGGLMGFLQRTFTPKSGPAADPTSASIKNQNPPKD